MWILFGNLCIQGETKKVMGEGKERKKLKRKEKVGWCVVENAI